LSRSDLVAVHAYGRYSGRGAARSIKGTFATKGRNTLMGGTITAFEWLRNGVPLSLLLDLASPEGPDSLEIARHEGRHSF
jgi:hypothetical protein